MDEDSPMVLVLPREAVTCLPDAVRIDTGMTYGEFLRHLMVVLASGEPSAILKDNRKNILLFI